MWFLSSSNLRFLSPSPSSQSTVEKVAGFPVVTSRWREIWPVDGRQICGVNRMQKFWFLSSSNLRFLSPSPSSQSTVENVAGFPVVTSRWREIWPVDGRQIRGVDRMQDPLSVPKGYSCRTTALQNLSASVRGCCRCRRHRWSKAGDVPQNFTIRRLDEINRMRAFNNGAHGPFVYECCIATTSLSCLAGTTVL